MENYEEKMNHLLKYLERKKKQKLNELKDNSDKNKKLMELGEIQKHIDFLEELKESK